MSNEATFAKSAVSTQEGRRWWLFTACVLVSLTNEVSTAVTNLSLGPMRRDLGASSAVMQIAVTLGKLMLGAFMLAGGVAGDVYGRRRVLVLGALGMVGASLLAAVAQTGGMLLVARALDGLASAAIAPMALALITGAFSQAEQARVIGLFLGLSGLGAALGPLGAGLVVQAQGWRAGFLMPAAVAALGGLGVFVFASGDGAKTEGRRLDGIGALTCAAGLLGLVFGIIQINQVGLAASVGVAIPCRWHRGPPCLRLVGTPGRGSTAGRYALSQSHRLCGRHHRITGRTGHGRSPFTAALFPANRAKGEPNLSDSSAHADDGCRRGVRTRGGETDGQDRTEKGHCRGAGAYGGR